MSSHRNFLRFAGLTALALGLVVLLSRIAPPEPRQPFNEELKRRLRRMKPDVVLLGNSMVNSRFSEPELERLLAPRRAAVIGVGGSKSAFWYLALKNVILPASKPREILLFYRRRELTTPWDRATGPEHRRLDRVTPEDDPFVEEVLAPRWDEPVARIGWLLGRVAPVSRLHALVEPRLDDVASSTARLLSGASGRAPEKRALASVFAVGKLRSSDIEPSLTKEEHGSFADALPRSFLPAIVELATSAGVKLTFVRVRTRQDALGLRPRRRKGGYEDQLERYLRKRGAEHLDMTGDDWETISLFGEGDHIAPRHRRRYTRLFVEHHRKVFD